MANEMNKTKNGDLEPAEVSNEIKKEKKPNIFKRSWNAVKAGARKVRESPVATAIGAFGGAALALGGKALLDWKMSKMTEADYSDPIEVEDLGEEVMDEETEEGEIEAND